MKKIALWLAGMSGLCVVLTVACSPYETKDPTAARVIMLKERNAQESDGAAAGTRTNSQNPPSGMAPAPR